MALPQSGKHARGAVDMSPLQQVWREIPSNERDWVLANKLNGTIDIDVTAGGTIALTADQQYGTYLIHLTGTPGAGFTIELLDGASPIDDTALAFKNLSGQTATIDTATGATPPLTITNGLTVMMQLQGIEILTSGLGTLPPGALQHDGAVPVSGNQDWLDFQVKKALFRDAAFTVTTPSSSSGTLTLNIELGNSFHVTLTEAVTTLTISNPANVLVGSLQLEDGTGNLLLEGTGDLLLEGSTVAQTIILIARQDSTGGWAITWPANVQWEQGTGGESPAQTTAPNAVDIYQFITLNGGVTWHGIIMSLDSK